MQNIFFHISHFCNYNWLNIFMDKLFPWLLPTAARDLCFFLREQHVSFITIGKGFHRENAGAGQPFITRRHFLSNIFQE